MKLILALTILAVVFTYGAAQWEHNYMEDLDDHEPSRKKWKTSDVTSTEQWFTQYLNHFDPADDRVWKQRYFVNDEYYEPNGPVFLFIGGEGAISDKWIYKGQMFDNAKRFGAMMFILEHRYYGKSQPTEDLSVENLAYLNAQQALLDTAYFIDGMNETHQLPNGTKWIVFGCSYSGSLAAWMRAKYPHLVRGAVSGSAPLLAKADFSEYMTVVYDTLKSHSQACVDTVVNAIRQFNEMIQNPMGRKKLQKLFNWCDPIDKSTTGKDLAYMHRSILSTLVHAVQYNRKHNNELKPPVDAYCDILVDEERGDLIDRLAGLSGATKGNASYDSPCRRLKYENLVHSFSEVVSRPYGVGARQWKYQTCTEFGFYQTWSAIPSLFGDGLRLDYFLKLCADIFGPQFKNLTHSGVERTNLIYGGLNLENVVSNVVFVHGTNDPWHKLGITKSSNPNAPAIFIKGTAHCANIYPAKEDDLPQLVRARKEMTYLIGQWLDQDELL